jgi:hypothetical protein
MDDYTSPLLSYTGYSLRKHIGNAIKARGQAIRTCLDKYNIAALALKPPRQILDWDEVVGYAFLSDFDLLRDSRQDIRSKPWAAPAARLATSQWYKYLRAGEEIMRLNVEIRRFQTYLHDEDVFLRSKETQVMLINLPLAHQIWRHRMERARFNRHHQRILEKICRLPGFSGNPLLGTHIPHISESEPSPIPLPPLSPETVPLDEAYNKGHEEAEKDLEEEQAGEDEDAAALDAYYLVLDVFIDPSHDRVLQ